MLYTYIVYLLAMPLNGLSLLYLVLVAQSAYTTIYLVTGIDAQAVQQQLAGAIPEKVAGGILAGLGVLFILWAIAVIVGAVIGQAEVTATEVATRVSDLVISPAWAVGGVLLWRRKALGYVTGLGLFFQASMLFVGLIAFLLLQPLLSTAPFALADVLVVAGMGLICFIPFGFLVRGVR